MGSARVACLRRTFPTLVRLDSVMKRHASGRSLVLVAMLLLIAVGACKKGDADPSAEAPPAPHVTLDFDVAFFKVDHPEQFPLVVATQHSAPSKLVVTGVVNPDIARTVP